MLSKHSNVLYACIISGIALISCINDFRAIRIIIAAYIITLIVFSSHKNFKLRFYFANDEESFFNTIFLAILLSSLTLIGLQKEAIFAALFLVIAHEFRKNALWNIAVFTIFGFSFFYLFYMLNNSIEVGKVFFLSLIGALASSLVESIKTQADKRFTVVLAAAATYTIFFIYSINVSILQLAVAFALSLVLSLAATKAGAADESGLMSATLIGTLIIVSTNIKFFAVLLLFYMVGSIVTRYKYSIKLERGIAEPAGGARGYSNVFGNSLAAMLFAMLYGINNDFFTLAFVASVATALGDTMASEIGKTAKNVYLITSFEKVEAGVNGGISLIGEIAALIGSFIIVAFALLLRLIELKWMPIVIFSSFVAIHIDSLLGATLETKGYLTNSLVNFIATLCAGLLCYLLFL